MPRADCETPPAMARPREPSGRQVLRNQRWLFRTVTWYPLQGCWRVRERQEAFFSSLLVVDGTGLGGPVVEMLRSAGLPCEITAVTITGGGRETRSGNLSVSVPKRDLIAGVQVALDNGELRIAHSLKELGPLVRELLDIRMTSAMGPGRVRIGAEGAGEHDDLVIALALACWRARRRENGECAQRLLCGEDCSPSYPATDLS